MRSEREKHPQRAHFVTDLDDPEAGDVEDRIADELDAIYVAASFLFGKKPDHGACPVCGCELYTDLGPCLGSALFDIHGLRAK